LTEIAVRAYTRRKKPKLKHKFDEKFPVFDRVLVFDTETTTDHYQNLKFGYFEVYQHNILEYNGIFYDHKTVKPKEFEILQQYSDEQEINLYTVEQFRKIFLEEVYDLETLCIGFNLGFDLERISIDIGVGRKSHKDGFSMLFSKNLNYPRLHLTHISNTLSFIEWGNTKSKLKNFKGNFVDLRTATNALTDKKYTLGYACKAFKTKYQKIKAKKHGKITLDYINYCIQDVKATYSLYLNVNEEFEKYELKIPITQAYTPAAIGKQILKKIGIESFFDKNPEFPKEIIGYCMCGYFGGRTESKIRKTPTLVNLLDFLSMYPTVCVLQELWKYVIAKKTYAVEKTDEISDFIESITIKDIQNPETWKKLPGIALVEPDHDVLPVRGKFGEKYAWNIGICNVSSKKPLWYSIADLVASKIVTGKTPKILKAYKFIAEGVQPNLKEIELFGIKINPYKQDLFKELIQYRQQLKDKRDSYSESDSSFSYYDRLQQVIKIIANATSYGIFVEIRTLDETKKIPIDVYGLTQFSNQKTKIEEAGFMFNPIIAISITSASRLLLATTEALLTKHGATYAYCDTDSMAIPPCYTKEIQNFFSELNPYTFDEEIFKLEKENVWFYGISSKRYCLYTIDKGNIIVDEKKFSAHGLGHLLDPFKNDPDDESKWHKEIWQDILDLHYNKVTRESLIEKYENKYAIQKLSISTPTIYSRVKSMNKGKDYYHQIKPGNFTLLGFSNKKNEDTGEPIKPFASYQNPPKYAVYESCIDYNDPTQTIQGPEYWKSIWDWFSEYLIHPEFKFDGDEGILQRKSITISNIVHIGKESNELETPLDDESYITYENRKELDKKFRELIPRILKLKPKDVKKFGISKQTLWNVKQKIKSQILSHLSIETKLRFLNYFQTN